MDKSNKKMDVEEKRGRKRTKPLFKPEDYENLAPQQVLKKLPRFHDQYRDSKKLIAFNAMHTPVFTTKDVILNKDLEFNKHLVSFTSNERVKHRLKIKPIFRNNAYIDDTTRLRKIEKIEEQEKDILNYEEGKYLKPFEEVLKYYKPLSVNKWDKIFLKTRVISKEAAEQLLKERDERIIKQKQPKVKEIFLYKHKTPRQQAVQQRKINNLNKRNLKILFFYTQTNKTHRQIAKKCNCSSGIVTQVIFQYRKNKVYKQIKNPKSNQSRRKFEQKHLDYLQRTFEEKKTQDFTYLQRKELFDKKFQELKGISVATLCRYGHNHLHQSHQVAVKVQVISQTHRVRLMRKIQYFKMAHLVKQGFDLISLDEKNTMENHYTRKAYAEKGKKPKRVEKLIPTNLTLIAAISDSQVICYQFVKGSNNSLITGNYMMDLLKRLGKIYKNKKRIPVICMDNSKLHLAGWIKEFLTVNKIPAIFTGPYFPDSNPIEELFNKLSRKLRFTNYRKSINSIVNAFHKELKNITAQELRQCYKKAFSFSKPAYKLEDVYVK